MKVFSIVFNLLFLVASTVNATIAVKPITLYYWGGSGLSQSIRYLLVQSGTKFRDARFKISERDTYFGFKELLIKRGFPFPNLPMVTDPSNGIYYLSQQLAIIDYLMNTHVSNLTPSNIVDRALTLQVANQVKDTLVNFFTEAFKDLNTIMQGERLENVKELTYTLVTLENLYSNKNSTFFFGHPSVIDFIVYSFLRTIEINSPGSITTKYQGLSLWAKSVSSLPRISAYENSESFKTIVFITCLTQKPLPVNWDFTTV